MRLGAKGKFLEVRDWPRTPTKTFLPRNTHKYYTNIPSVIIKTRNCMISLLNWQKPMKIVKVDGQLKVEMNDIWISFLV